jgi:hypothetical protein
MKMLTKVKKFINLDKSSVEVIDANQPGCASKWAVMVAFVIFLKNGKRLSLSFQPNDSPDANSADLSICTDTEDFGDLASYCDDINIDFEVIENYLKKQTNAQKLYDDYLERYEIVND